MKTTMMNEKKVLAHSAEGIQKAEVNDVLQYFVILVIAVETTRLSWS
jgi:hypothetical protein